MMMMMMSLVAFKIQNYEERHCIHIALPLHFLEVYSSYMYILRFWFHSDWEAFHPHITQYNTHADQSTGWPTSVICPIKTLL